jgi:hypothetical protein
MINAILMVAAAGFGFGGWPWESFVLCASLMVLSAIPKQQEILKRYRGEPKTDIVFSLLLRSSLTVLGPLASAWFGYLLARILKF